MEAERKKLKCVISPVSAFFKSIILAFSIIILVVKIILKVLLNYPFFDTSTVPRTIGTVLLLIGLAGIAYKFAKLYYDYRWYVINCGE